MKKSSYGIIALCKVIFVSTILLCGCAGSQEYPLVRRDASKLQEKNSEGGWSLTEQIDSDIVTLEGRIETDDYPYGYNVGMIEDEVVGTAVLLTPLTSIEIHDVGTIGNELYLSYAIHPSVVADSDGALLNVQIIADGNDEGDIYQYPVDAVEREQTVSLEAFEGKNINIKLYVSNEAEKGEECDWVILGQCLLR